MPPARGPVHIEIAVSGYRAVKLPDLVPAGFLKQLLGGTFL